MRGHVRWLHRQLPGLVEAGVVDEDTAARLRDHYGPAEGPDLVRRVAVVVFGVLGACLVGAGVILLIGRNWEELSRPLRAALSLGLLVGAQGVAGFAAWKRPDAPAWTESAGAGLLLALGACLALISQTYHLQGELHAFLRTWLLLSLPVPWLLGARFAAVLWLAGLLAWSVDVGDAQRWWLLVAALPLAPFVARTVTRAPAGGMDHVVGWAAASAALVGAGLLADNLGGAGFLVPAAAAGALLASATHPRASAAWRVPATTLGALVGAGLLLGLSWEGSWRGVGLALSPAGGLPVLAVTLALAGYALARGRALVAAGQPGRASGAGLVAVVAVGWALAQGAPLLAAVWVNLALLAGGAALMADGFRKAALGRANAGLALLTALLVVRFFDADLPSAVRGLAFIALGLASLGVNAWLLRRRGEVSP